MQAGIGSTCFFLLTVIWKALQRQDRSERLILIPSRAIINLNVTSLLSPWMCNFLPQHLHRSQSLGHRPDHPWESGGTSQAQAGAVDYKINLVAIVQWTKVSRTYRPALYLREHQRCLVLVLIFQAANRRPHNLQCTRDRFLKLIVYLAMRMTCLMMCS